MKRILPVILFLIAVPHAHPGDIPITWSGEMRVRGEIDGRDFSSRSPANAFGLLRARLGARITPAEKSGIVFQLQGARLFGQSTGDDISSPVPTTTNIELYQGYLSLFDILFDGFSISAGRIELSYGDQRIIGPSDWGNNGRSFDGIGLTYRWAEHRVDAFLMNIIETQAPPDVVTPFSVAPKSEEGRSLSGIYASLGPAANLWVDLYLLREWTQHQTFPGADDLSRFTGGTRVEGSWGFLDYQGEITYQFGTRFGNDISAYMLRGEVGYSFSESPVTSASIGYEHLSGTSLDDRQYRTFEAPYQSSHGPYGLMDYFKALPENTYGRGLQDAYFSVTFRPHERLSITASGHAFWLAQSLIGLWSLGEEIDLVASCGFNNHVTLEFGASGFLPDELMRVRFGGSDIAWWGYSSVRVWFL